MLIIFGNAANSHIHIAVYAGTYNGADFIIHVGNERGPEISTVEAMGHSSNGDKASSPTPFTISEIFFKHRETLKSTRRTIKERP